MSARNDFPVLQTKRFLLRQITLEDTAAVFAFRSDPLVQRYNGGALTQLEQAADLIGELTTGHEANTIREWGVTLKEGDGSVLSLFGYANWALEHRRAEIGYCLHRAYWRQGLALEALTAILAFGFHTMDLHRIHACPHAENEASVRLMEQLGFVREGVLREELWEEGAFHDLALYALLQREYFARSRA